MKQIINFFRGSLVSIISFQLAFLSVPQAFAESCSDYDSVEDQELITKQQACDNADDGTSWSCSQGKCITSQAALDEQATVRAEFTSNAEECEQKTTDAERRQCYEDKASEQAGGDLDEGDYGWQEGLAQTMEGLSIGLAVANFISTKKILVPKCITLTIFNIAAVAFIASELYYYFSLKGDLDALKDQYVNNEDPFAAQLDAFTYLKDEQEALQEILKIKAIMATVIAILYTAAAVAGYIEQFTPTAAKTCDITGGAQNSPEIKDPLMEIFQTQKAFAWNPPTDLQLGDSDNPLDTLISFIDWSNYLNGERQSVTLSQYNGYQSVGFLQEFTLEDTKVLKEGLTLIAQLKNFAIPAAMAADSTPDSSGTLFEEETAFENGLYIAILTGAVGALGGALAASSEAIKKFFATPLTVAIMSTVMAASEWILTGHYWTQYGETQGHIDMLDDIIKRFETSMTGYCSEADRQSLSVPKCYCYNDDGTRNTSERGNSQTCQAFWKAPGSDVSFAAASNDAATTTGRRGCVALNGEFDLECKCRQYRDSSSGNNACFKSNKSALSLNGIGNSLSLGSMATGVDNMAQGNYDRAAFGSSNSLNNRAARAKKLLKKFEKNADAKLKKLGKPSTGQLGAVMAKAVGKLDSPQMRSHFGNFMPAQAAQAAQGKAKNAVAIKKALKKTGLSKLLYSKKRGKKKKAKMNFDFLQENEGAKSLSRVNNDDFMGKKYKIKHNDIVKNEDVSIWKVLSNRYNQTGLRVLFED